MHEWDTCETPDPRIREQMRTAKQTPQMLALAAAAAASSAALTVQLVEEEEEDDGNICIICLDKPSTITFLAATVSHVRLR